MILICMIIIEYKSRFIISFLITYIDRDEIIISSNSSNSSGSSGSSGSIGSSHSVVLVVIVVVVILFVC